MLGNVSRICRRVTSGNGDVDEGERESLTVRLDRYGFGLTADRTCHRTSTGEPPRPRRNRFNRGQADAGPKRLDARKVFVPRLGLELAVSAVEDGQTP